jgi:hypothetical protein
LSFILAELNYRREGGDKMGDIALGFTLSSPGFGGFSASKCKVVKGSRGSKNIVINFDPVDIRKWFCGFSQILEERSNEFHEFHEFGYGRKRPSED